MHVAAAPADATSTAAAPTQGLGLGKVLGREASGWRIRMRGEVRVFAADPAVDPALLDECVTTGATVVIDAAANGTIVGVLATARAVTIDRRGIVDAQVKRFRVTAEDEALLRTASAFLRVKGGDAEICGHQVVARARELCRLLGRMIKLN